MEEAVDEVCYPKPSEIRSTSRAERAMRELNRRTDVGAPWSVRGIGNLLRLRLARRYNPHDYARAWRDLNDELVQRFWGTGPPFACRTRRLIFQACTP